MSTTGTSNVLLDSLDGKTWTVRSGSTAPKNPQLLAVGPSGALVIGAVGANFRTWTSTDAKSWTLKVGGIPMPATADGVTVTAVAAWSGGWIAVGRADPMCMMGCGNAPSHAYVWRSADGSNWRRVADQPSLKGAGMVGVTASGGKLIAAGTGAGRLVLWTSTDGATWKRAKDLAAFHSKTKSLTTTATGITAAGGIIVVAGVDSGAQNVGGGNRARAWWSADASTWTESSVAKAVDGQVFSVAAVSSGFLATGPSGKVSCLGGIWASPDGRSFACVASDKRFTGFRPYAAAGSDTVDVVVGLTSKGWSSSSGAGMPGAAWYRAHP
jgi:hypothetical protein